MRRPKKHWRGATWALILYNALALGAIGLTGFEAGSNQEFGGVAASALYLLVAIWLVGLLVVTGLWLRGRPDRADQSGRAPRYHP